MNQEAMPWLEPCIQFIKAASRATLLAKSSNRGAKLKFIKFAGSNHRLQGRRATWAWRGPWAALARNSRDFKLLDGVPTEEMGSCNFFNPVGFQESSPSIIKEWSLPDVIRTWFVNNWAEWEWPVDFAEELEKIGTELSTGAIENANDKNDSFDDEEAREQIKKNS